MVKRVEWMSRGKLLAKVDAERVKEAIRKAELATSGEIRVSVAPSASAPIGSDAISRPHLFEISASRARPSVEA